MVEHVDVQLALLRKAGERQVAAAEIADHRVDRVGPEEQVELGVQRMAEKQFDDDLLGLDLCRQPAQPGLVVVRRDAEGQLLAELFGELFFEPQGFRIVDAGFVFHEAQGCAQIFLRQPLHADEQPATMTFAARPLLNVRIDLFPATKVEIADTKIGVIRDLEGLPEGRQ